MTNNNNRQRKALSEREKRLKKRKTNNNISTAMEVDEVEEPEEEIMFTPVGNSTPAEEDSSEDERGISDDETVRGGSNRRTPHIVHTRCTLKLKVMGGKNAFGKALSLVKEFFIQLKKFDKWACIVPWYENVVMGVTEINDPKDIMMDPTSITSYLPRFMNRKVKTSTKYDEYVSIQLGHSVELEELLLDLGTWLQNGEHALYIDMLQAERKREAAYYKDDDSISTRASLRTETPSSRTTNNASSNSHTHTTSRVMTTEGNIPNSWNENLSVASSITMESFTNLQNQVIQQDSKLLHIEQLIGKVAEVVLKGDQVSHPMSTNEDEVTGGTESTSGEGL